MKKLLYLALAAAVGGVYLASCAAKADAAAPESKFVSIDGVNLVKPDGEKLYIRGTNLGNWLNPEGYMFGFSKTNSGRMINEMLCEMVGPDYVADFWQKFKDNYVTRKDIEFIASTGANTIRLPFHYKLFTNEDYMGLNNAGEGFARIDSAITWCRDNGLYLILDMHDCPGGQTGDNIDDSYGYPWIFESEKSQQQFCDIWRTIAARYKNEPVILGYELMNEPIPHYMDNKEELETMLEPLYKRGVAAIREVDTNHIILLGGSRWNGNFKPFTDWKFDGKIMYTCHRYGSEPTAEAIGEIIAFRDSTGLPMYMGEIGHNSDEWQRKFCDVMEQNNIGYTFWPYKKIDQSCIMGIKRPADWDTIVAFSEADRSTYAAMRHARPCQVQARQILDQWLENVKAENCIPQVSYIESIKLKAPKQ